jgi:hypothetical protein
VVTAATHWDKWVAIGTLALAGTTFLAVLVGIRTARLTRRLADAAQTTAKADTRALENSVRPLLLPVPPRLYTAPATYSFRNIGYGRREQILRTQFRPSNSSRMRGWSLCRSETRASALQ